MSLLFSNNAQTTIAGSISNTALAVALAPGTGAEFPTPAAGQTFFGTFNDAATGLLYEIVSVTARSTDTLTIVRAQEGTVALAWNAGDIFGNFMTAGTAAAFVQLPLSSNPAGGGLSVTQVYAGNPNGHIAGNAGVAATSAPDIVWDTTDGVWWTCIATGSTSTAVWERAPTPIAGVTRNLLGSSSGAVKTAGWTADEITFATALAGATYTGTSLTLSFNGAGTGANGMDTGSMPSGSSLYIYGIYNPTTGTAATLGTVAGAGATIYAGLNMPAGYTASCLIWCGVTSGTNFQRFYQRDRTIWVPSTNVVSNGASNAGTTFSVSTICPVNAVSFAGNFSIAASTGPAAVYGDANLIGFQQLAGIAGLATNYADVPLITSQTSNYQTTGATTVSIAVDSYKF